MMSPKHVLLISMAFSLCCVVCLYPDSSYAALSNAGLLDTVLLKYKDAAKLWADEIQKRATWIFITLATISMVWMFAQLMFHRSSLAEFFGEMIRFLMFTGFFLWLLRNGPVMADAIIASLIKIGLAASKQQGTPVSPSGIVDVGFKVLSLAKDSFALTEPFVSLGIIAFALGILVILALVGINMLLQLCAAWVLAYAGIFFLGFGGSRWTSDMAINYFKAVLGTGASLMTMTLLVGIGTGIMNEAQVKMQSDPLNLEELGVLLVFSITLFLLVDKLPAMVAGIITGASIGSVGIGNFGAGAAVGAAMTAGSFGGKMASVAGGATMNAAANMAGLVSSIKTIKSGGGASDGGGNAADAMGSKSPSAMDVSKALGKAAFQVATGKAAGKADGGGQGGQGKGKQSFAERTANSFGGRMAATLQQGKKGKE